MIAQLLNVDISWFELGRLGSTISFLPLEMLAIVLKGSVVIAGTCSIAIPLSSFETLLLGYGA